MKICKPYIHRLRSEGKSYYEVIEDVFNNRTNEVVSNYEHSFSTFYFYETRSDLRDLCEYVLSVSFDKGMNVFILDRDNMIGTSVKVFHHNEYHMYVHSNGILYNVLINVDNLISLMSGECAMSAPHNQGSSNAKKLEIIVRNVYDYKAENFEQNVVYALQYVPRTLEITTLCDDMEVDSRYAEGSNEKIPLSLVAYHDYMRDVKMGLDVKLEADNPVLKVRNGYIRKQFPDATEVLYNRDMKHHVVYISNSESIPRRLTLPNMKLEYLIETCHIIALGTGSGDPIGHTTISCYVGIDDDLKTYAIVVPSYLNHLDEAVLTKFVYEMTDTLCFVSAHGPTNFNVDILDVIATIGHSVYSNVVSALLSQRDNCFFKSTLNSRCKIIRYSMLNPTIYITLDNILTCVSRSMLHQIMERSMLLSCDTTLQLLSDLDITQTKCMILPRRFWLFSIPICARNSRVKGARFCDASDSIDCKLKVRNDILMPKACFIYDNMQTLPCGFTTTIINPCIHWR